MRVVGPLLLGGFVGILTGMFGVGGGFLTTPLLNIILGTPMHVAVGTGALNILGVSTAGLYRRRREGLIDYKMSIVLLGGNLAGVRLGVGTLEWLKGLGELKFNGQTMPAADFYILSAFLVLLGGIAGWMIYDTSRNTEPPAVRVGLFSRIKLPPYTEFDSLDRPRLSIPVLSYFGLILGFMTGLLGIGGGVIMLPSLVYLVGQRTHRATATSLAMVWLSSLVATIGHSMAGNSDFLLAIPLMVSGAIGLQLGVSLSERVGGPRLRRYFSLVVIAAMALVAAKIMTVAL